MNKTIKVSNAIALMVITFLVTLGLSLIIYNSIDGLSKDVLKNNGGLGEKILDTKAVEDGKGGLNSVEYKKALELIEYINQHFYIDTKDVDFKSGIYKGVFESLNDPYSTYMSASEFKAFSESSEGSYGGIGIQIEPGKDNLITIVAPFEDTPGDKAGLKTGDKIIKVNGKEVYADTMDAAIKQMKGEPDTDVTLTIFRVGEEIFDVTITRAKIVLQSVKSRMININKGEKKIGYLRLTSFDQKVYSEFVKHYKEVKKNGAQSLIIDLRNNPGGSLQQVVQVADFILDKQLIVYTMDRAGHKVTYDSGASHINLPIAVLVNGGSASASEILTGAIKDSGSGTVIGTTTFGKGLVQSVIPLKDGDGIKLTTAQYFTPNGTYIHGVGIEPDIIIEQSKDFIASDDQTDVQLQKAIDVLTK